MLKDADVQQEVTELNLGSKIRQLRKRKGMTLQNISDYTGLSKPLLSQVENGVIAPPLGTLIKISKALGVSIGYFFQESSVSHRICIVRKGERRRVVRSIPDQKERVGYHYESLAYQMADRQMEPFIVTFEPTDSKDQKIYSHTGEEFLFIQKGKLEFRGAGKTLILEEGDSLYFDSGIPHALRGVGDEPAKALAVIYSPH